MKRGTPDHPKMDHLSALLEIPRYAAVGIVESVWHLAQQYAKRGDIGKFAPEVIARKIDWSTACGRLGGWIDAVATGFGSTIGPTMPTRRSRDRRKSKG